MTATVWFVLAIVLVALTFDFINGFHDSANSIATIVSTRVLSPGMAVIWAAFFNFVAAFGLGTAVAKTIGKGLIDLSVVEPIVILGGLIGAIVWDLITWWGGLPTSSSHALIGGYAGAAVAKAGFAAIIAQGSALGVIIAVPALNWIVVAEIPSTEAFSQVARLRNVTLGVVTVCVSVPIVGVWTWYVLSPVFLQAAMGSASSAAPSSILRIGGLPE